MCVKLAASCKENAENLGFGRVFHLHRMLRVSPEATVRTAMCLALREDQPLQSRKLSDTMPTIFSLSRRPARILRRSKFAQ